MVDTYLLPEVHIVITQVPGVDGTPNTARLTQIEGDLATLLGRPVIHALTDVPDVVGAPTAGQTLVWDATESEWQPGNVGLPLAATAYGTTIQAALRLLNFTFGLSVTADEPFSGFPRANVSVIFGGTGSANAAARSDHTHSVRPNTRAPFSATGTMSSGTRSLISGTVTGLTPGISYMVDAILIGDLRGEGSGAGYTQAQITLNGNMHLRFGGSGQIRTVAGVDREFTMQHGGTTVSGVSSFTYSAEITYQSGDPINVGAGELVIRLRPSR